MALVQIFSLPPQQFFNNFVLREFNLNNVYEGNDFVDKYLVVNVPVKFLLSLVTSKKIQQMLANLLLDSCAEMLKIP